MQNPPAKKKLDKRNLSKDRDEALRLLPWWQADVVEHARVMVVGSGALGNEVLKNLALLSVGHILIVDFDKIEYSNLSRSVLFREKDAEQNRLKVDAARERVKELNPKVKVMTLNGDITLDVGLGIFRRMDAIIGCLDNREARLAINKFAFWVNQAWVDGGIENLNGEMKVFKPGIACYETELDPAELAIIKYRKSCPHFALKSIAMGRIPTTPIAASIIAAMQVQEAMKLIHKNDEKLAAGKSFYYDGNRHEITFHLMDRPAEQVESNKRLEPIRETPLSADDTIEKVLQYLQQHFQTEEVSINLHFRLVVDIIPQTQNKSVEVFKPYQHLTEDLVRPYLLDDQEEIVIGDELYEIDRDFPRKDLRLRDIGIPYLDILSVFAKDDFHYMELSADEKILDFK